jgi:NAD(P)-dependent dehydrogenase (short-subunit alcohol dehydrogenase family)
MHGVLIRTSRYSESDFAGTILFMASRAGAYLNGETMLSDGGRLAQLPATY